MNKKNKIIIILSILAVLFLGIVLISNHNKNNDIKIGNDSEISQNDDNNEETRKYETEPVRNEDYDNNNEIHTRGN